MPSVRAGLVQVGCREATVIADDLQAGDSAPEFQAHSPEWEEICALDSTRPLVRIAAALTLLGHPGL